MILPSGWLLAFTFAKLQLSHALTTCRSRSACRTKRQSHGASQRCGVPREQLRQPPPIEPESLEERDLEEAQQLRPGIASQQPVLTQPTLPNPAPPLHATGTAPQPDKLSVTQESTQPRPQLPSPQTIGPPPIDPHGFGSHRAMISAALADARAQVRRILAEEANTKHINEAQPRPQVVCQVPAVAVAPPQAEQNARRQDPEQKCCHDWVPRHIKAHFRAFRGTSPPAIIFWAQKCRSKHHNGSGLCLGQFLDAFPPAFYIGQEVLVTAKGHDEQAGSLRGIVVDYDGHSYTVALADTGIVSGLKAERLRAFVLAATEVADNADDIAKMDEVSDGPPTDTYLPTVDPNEGPSVPRVLPEPAEAPNARAQGSQLGYGILWPA